MRRLRHTQPRSRRVLLWAAAISMTMILPSCKTTSGGKSVTASALSLPDARTIVSDPVTRPKPQKGENAKVFSRRALDYGDENGNRLTQSRERYQREVVDRYGNTVR